VIATRACRRISVPTWVTILVFIFAAPAGAQFMKQEIVLTTGAGLQFPTGVFENEVKTGGHGLVDGSYFVNPSWSLGVRAGYFNFRATESANAAAGHSRVRYLTLGLDAHLMLYPESWFTPYALVGAGISQERTWFRMGDAPEATHDVVRPEFSGGFGLSAHRQGAWWAVFTEVIYHHLPTDDGSRQYLAWTGGLRFCLGGRPF
jgi:hypothetical protein